MVELYERVRDREREKEREGGRREGRQSFGHVTEDSIESKREKLDVRLTEDGMLSISGQMQVFPGEPLIRVQLKAVAPNGELEIPYVAGDKVFLSWKSISEFGTDSEQEFAAQDAMPKYDRTRDGLSIRFECLMTALSENARVVHRGTEKFLESRRSFRFMGLVLFSFRATLY